MKKQEPVSKVALVNNCLRNMEAIVNERWELIDMLKYKNLQKEEIEFIENYSEKLLNIYNEYKYILEKIMPGD